MQEKVEQELGRAVFTDACGVEGWKLGIRGVWESDL